MGWGDARVSSEAGGTAGSRRGAWVDSVRLNSDRRSCSRVLGPGLLGNWRSGRSDSSLPAQSASVSRLGPTPGDAHRNERP